MSRRGSHGRSRSNSSMSATPSGLAHSQGTQPAGSASPHPGGSQATGLATSDNSTDKAPTPVTERPPPLRFTSRMPSGKAHVFSMQYDRVNDDLLVAYDDGYVASWSSDGNISGRVLYAGAEEGTHMASMAMAADCSLMHISTFPTGSAASVRLEMETH